MKPQFFCERRKVFSDRMKEGTFAMLTSGQLVVSTNDEDYRFEVDRNFYYLTGIDFPGMILSVEKDRGGSVSCVLFAPDRDPDKEKWTGFIPSHEELSEKSLIDISSIRSIGELDDYLTGVGESGRFSECYAYFRDVEDMIPEPATNLLYYRLCDEFLDIEVIDIMDILMPMRAVKTPEEVEAVIDSARITHRAIEEVMKDAVPGRMEYEEIALFNYIVARSGARLAFHTIAASGEYGTILHYIEGENEIKDGSLLLLDCGAAKDWYNSDVTRTFPANGRFDERQKEVYGIVLACNKMIAEKARPGITLIDLNDMTKAFLASELRRIGLISSDEELSKYYYHSISHSLGLDTHDAFSKDMPLAPGMIITDEPGLYIREWGIGVRIEDDLLITEDGCRVLTDFIPKEIDEIEAFMASAR